MRRHRQSIWTNSLLSTAAGVACGFLCMFLMTAAAAIIIYFVIGNMRPVRFFTGAALGTGAYIGAYILGKYRRRKGLISGAVCGIIMYAVLLTAAAAILGEFTGIKKLLLLTASAAAGGVMGVNSKRPKNLRD